MEKSISCWSQEKAKLHHKIASILLIISGISGLYLSLDDIIILGNRLSAFVLPYFFNYLGFFLSIFQIYIAICFLNKQKWAKTAILCVLLIRLFMGYYDIIEIIPVVFVLPYIMFILPKGKIGSLFEENNSEVGA